MSQDFPFDNINSYPGIMFQYEQEAHSYHFDYISDKIESYFGLRAEQVYENARLWFEIVLSSDRTDFESSLDQAGSNLTTWNWQGRIKRRDGSIGVFRWSAQPTILDNGGIRWCGFVVEFLENDQLSRNLIESEKKFSSLFNDARDMIHLVSPDGRIVDVNQVELDKLEYKREEYIGKPIVEIIHPEYLEAAKPTIKKVFQGEVLENVESVLIGKYGKEIPVEVAVIPYMEQDRVVYARTIMRDISARKKAKDELEKQRKDLERLIQLRTGQLHAKDAQFNILLDNAADSIIIHNSDGKILDCNQHVCDSLGYAYQEMVKKSLFDFEIGVGPGQIIPILKNFSPGKEASYQGVHLRKDGVRYPVDVRTTAYEAGGELSFIAVARDITEQKRIEQEMIEAKEGAEQANREKSVFLSRMSHELRTPLNAIIGFSQLLEVDGKASCLTENQFENVKEILKAGQHLLNLVNDVLDLSNIESGNVRLSSELCNIHEVIAESNSVVKHIAQERGVQIEIRDETSANTYILVDHVRIRQVLINLLSNGVKYNKQGGTVTIRIHCSDDNSLVILSIVDTGIGMTSEQQANMFVPFDRLGRESSNIEGTGIGLHLTQLLIEAMGGSLVVNSRPDEGSEFVVSFKRHSGNVNIEEVKPMKAKAKHTGGSKKILYVEDNLANLKLVESIFKDLSDYELITAMDPERGIAIARQEIPALILLDINLPVLNGIEVLRILKQNEKTKTIPIVALTANAMQEDIDIAMASGFDDYLIKPVNIEELLQVVEHQLTGGVPIH